MDAQVDAELPAQEPAQEPAHEPAGPVLRGEAQRVLGCLIEKQLATPNQYPLTLNSLRTACNQATNRDPVVDFSDADVQQGLTELREHGLSRTIAAQGARAWKYEHRIEEVLDLRPPEVAVLAVLLLRGPQTPGELRQRTGRLHAFDGVDDVQAVLDGLAGRSVPLVEEQPRRPGQKETRWAHRLGPDQTAAGGSDDAPEEDVAALRARIAELEATVADLRRQLAEG